MAINLIEDILSKTSPILPVSTKTPPILPVSTKAPPDQSCFHSLEIKMSKNIVREGSEMKEQHHGTTCVKHPIFPQEFIGKSIYWSEIGSKYIKERL